MIPLLIALAAAAPPLAPPAPQPAEVKVFGDWAVACDNGLRCEAVSLTPGDNNIGPLNMMLTRDPGPNGAISIEIKSSQGIAGPAKLKLDGKQVAEGRLGPLGNLFLNGAAAMPLAEGLADAGRLTVTGIGGTGLGSISMKGSGAAMRYIDAEQGRAGGMTALAAKGPAPAGMVPPPPPLPVIYAPPPVRDVAPPLPPAMLAAMRQRNGCDIQTAAPDTTAAYTLDGRDTLVLLFCGSGAYNATSAPLIVSGGAVRPAAFDVPVNSGDPGAPTMLMNPEWDRRTGILTTRALGRGLGDCGVKQQFVWDGERFRLIEQEEMGECRGAIAWPTTWRATVRR
ncbi:MAG TPA: DUF1176 domain-containing protein [Sphingomonas sp.]|nr:DUF1176 domain-containing protein [Sphingomonas sp.]